MAGRPTNADVLEAVENLRTEVSTLRSEVSELRVEMRTMNAASEGRLLGGIERMGSQLRTGNSGQSPGRAVRTIRRHGTSDD